jgi:5-hydroxyisourate hydrolase
VSGITTHVLDTSVGRPAAGVAVHLERADADDCWETIGRADSDADGRVRQLVPEGATLAGGVYRLIFDTAAYFRRSNTPTFYPHVIVVFEIVDTTAHYHVPLLISPFGYSTYRGT